MKRQKAKSVKLAKNEIICSNCEIILAVDDDIISEEIIQCPNCDKIISNPFFFSGEYVVCGCCGNNGAIPKEFENHLVLNCQSCGNDLYNPHSDQYNKIICPECHSESHVPEDLFNEIFLQCITCGHDTIDNPYFLKIPPASVSKENSVCVDNSITEDITHNLDNTKANADYNAELHSVCSKCNAYLKIPEKFSNDLWVKCPNCQRSVKNPLYYKKKRLEKEKRAGIVTCSSCYKQFEVTSEYVDKYHLECPYCVKFIKNPLRDKNLSTPFYYNLNFLFFLLIVILAFYLFVTFANNGPSRSSSYSEPVRSTIYVINNDTYAVETMSDFRVLERYFRGDSQALVSLNARGRTKILLQGLEVKLLETGSSHAVVEITKGYGRGERYYVRRRDISRKR